MKGIVHAGGSGIKEINTIDTSKRNVVVRHNYRNKIVYLSFILSICIIVRHSVGVDVYTLPQWLFFIESFIFHLTDLVVPVFFAISGFLFFYNLEGNNLEDKLKRRVQSIVIPFLIWSFMGYLFFIIVDFFLGDYMNRESSDFLFPDTLVDIFIFTKYNITWFLGYLIVYIYLIPLLLKILKNEAWGGVLLLLMLAIGYYFHIKILVYAVPYAMGAFLGLHYKDFVLSKYSFNLKLFSLIFILFSVLIETCLQLPQEEAMIPLRLLQICAVWIIADDLAIETKPKVWMTISFFIYCCHAMVLESIEKLFLILLGDTLMGAVLDFVLAPIITFMILLFLSSLIKKRPVLWKTLNGGR